MKWHDEKPSSDGKFLKNVAKIRDVFDFNTQLTGTCFGILSGNREKSVRENRMRIATVKWRVAFDEIVCCKYLQGVHNWKICRFWCGGSL